MRYHCCLLSDTRAVLPKVYVVAGSAPNSSQRGAPSRQHRLSERPPAPSSPPPAAALRAPWSGSTSSCVCVQEPCAVREAPATVWFSSVFRNNTEGEEWGVRVDADLAGSWMSVIFEVSHLDSYLKRMHFSTC